jgi:hypothetical protein
LAKIAEETISKPWSFGSEQSAQGLRRDAWNPKSGEILRFRIDADSPAMPDERKYALLRHYILEAVPEIRVFKTPIPPENFHIIPPDPFAVKRSSAEPDLILKLNPGKLAITFSIQKSEPKVSEITVARSDIDAVVSHTSGAIVSLEDLAGSQAIIYLPPRKDFPEPWSTASRHLLRCRVNDQIVAVSSDFTVPTSGVFSRLVSTQTLGSLQKQLIYSFTFPTPAPAKVNH